MTYQVIIPVLVAFAITAVLGPVIIPFLRKLKIGNTEREELESHQKKNGTPTMGFFCDGRIWNHWIPG